MNSNSRLRLQAIAALTTIALSAAGQKENMETIADAHHLSAYFVAALMISVFVMLFSNRLFYFRQREVSLRAQQLNRQLRLVMASNRTQVWTYDPLRRVYTLLSKGDDERAFSPIDFAQLFDTNDFTRLHQAVTAMAGQSERPEDMEPRSEIEVRGHRSENSAPPAIFMITLTVLQRDRQGKPKMLLGIQRDTTESNRRKAAARSLALRYHTVFNSSLVDMTYFDVNGRLTDINDKACETFGIADREALIQRGMHFADIPAYRELDFDHLESLQMVAITDIDRSKREDERIPELTIGGKIYYECAVSAVRDQDNRLHGVIAAGRNITDMVESYHRQHRDAELLEKRTLDIESYINSINYSLKVSGVRLVNYHPDTHELQVFSDLGTIQYSLSQIRCASILVPGERRRARGLMRRMDHRAPGSLTETLETRLRDDHRRNVMLTFSMLPVRGKDGTVSHYFGMLRNDTEMVYTERQLLKETRKAQETEELKNTFLLNMSYEIRTPLNAVVGFAELMNQPHDADDEPVFSEEIKRNTNQLLALVNDILYISRLDARMVDFNWLETDFATLFDAFCYMGWSATAPGVQLQVENPYRKLLVVIDEQHMGEVISKLCQNAARMTTAGTLRAKYDYRHGEINISIEDTGRGLSPEDLPHVFERFARDKYDRREGTGLDMAITKELVEQMGGTIEIQSEEGKGTAVYVMIPCEMREMVKK